MKDTEETLVIFRKFKTGEIIALFPEIDEGNYLCSSYMKIGQHSSADYSGVIQKTKRASMPEYHDLRRELESIGYNLKIRNKWIKK